MICDWRISIRFVCFCVSRFIACDGNSVIMIEGSKNAILKAAFELESSHVCEKRSNGVYNKQHKLA